MKNMIMCVLLPMLFACSADDSEERRDDTVGKEIADDYNQQMDKARDVENQLMEQKRQIDEAIDESEQGNKEP